MSQRHRRAIYGIDSMGRPAYVLDPWSEVPVTLQRARQTATGRTPVDVGSLVTLASLAPTSGSLAGGPITVTLTGTNFNTRTTGLFNGNFMPLNYISATSMTAALSMAGPSYTLGAKDVIAVGQDGRTSATRTFTINA